MATVSKIYDVKINIIRPYVTKNISVTDTVKINETTALKYETLKTVTPEGSLQEPGYTDEEVVNYLSNSIKELDEIYDAFDDLSKRAEKELSDVVYTYDISLPENEMIANAERSLFGSASGIITFAKYKKVLAFDQILNREISERMVNNNGVLDVA